MTDRDFYKVDKLTNIVIRPQARIATFWTTRFRYYIISKIDNSNSLLRIGTISCEKPTIITPKTITDAFDGFSSEDMEFAEYLSGNDIDKIKVLGYQFKNKLESIKKISIPYKILIQNIKKTEEKSLNNIAIVTAPNQIWSLSITKLAMESIFRSFASNIQDLEERGFFLNNEEKTHQEIEILFGNCRRRKI